MAKKFFVLSSNALASSSESYRRFGDHTVVIADIVIDELGELAKRNDTKGRNADKILKFLDKFNFSELASESGIPIGTGKLRVEYGFKDVKVDVDNTTASQYRRLQVALGIKGQLATKSRASKTTTPVILISRNAAFRIKAKSLGIKSEDYIDEVFPSLDEQYKGRVSVTASIDNIKTFEKEGTIDVKKLHKSSTLDLVKNEFVEISDINNNYYTKLGRYDGKQIVKLNYANYYPFGVMPKNDGQAMIIEACMTDPDLAPNVIIKGDAGTGKTYVTLACALEQTLEKSIYDRIIISTSVSNVGGENEEVGFLPGDITEKFSPHIGGFMDNLRLLCNKKNKKNDPDNTDYLFAKNLIEMQPIGFLRGRTITNAFIIIDESQNISPEDIKSIATRAGEGTKMVFLGDQTQIDRPKLNERYNGLVYLSEKMKGYEGTWQATLSENENVRSAFARYAAKVL